MPIPLAPLLKFLAVPFSFLSRIGWFFIGTKFGRTGIIIILALLAFLFTPIKNSIEAGNPQEIIDVIVTRLVSGDNGMDQETNKIIELQEAGALTTKEMIMSLLRIYILFHFSFYILGWALWKVADLQDNSADLRNIIFTIVMLIILQVSGSIYLLSQKHEGDFSEDIEYILGDKSLIETAKFLNPVKGIINFVTHIDIFLEPLALFVERIYH